MRCAVVGAGAWGTALADLLAANGAETSIWAHEPEVVQAINERHENTVFLAGHRLPESLRATADAATAVAGARLIIMAAPSPHVREVTRAMASSVARGAVVVVASKGLERGSLSLMTDVVAEELGDPVVALSGPSFAAEVAARQPTAIVAASTQQDAAELTQQILSNTMFRVYTHDDVTGVELGGALKNVMAVATGVAEGLGFGYNTRAALITRGLAEMSRLGAALGASPATFAGLAGMGDLVLTCTGALSRNRALGIEIGKGATLAEALAGKATVAEGANTTESACALADRHGVEMPIATMVRRVLFEGYSARDAVGELMTRDLRAERDS
ncbi:MAG TPA: NAD(P)H-dependent glycerol-3-phosphate dehydrogenase [Gemmatimonadaceae bacterium]|nr:NAD(P)H-dependent glycerol-3-phosphate dehydrogenase [Gemmatimonadaceae bacterium]